MNVLTRERICKTFEVSPGELIDMMAWAMKNPSDPIIVKDSDSPVMENTQKEVNLDIIPIPWH